jgi:23S rRNA (uracil1939-C5)-methyltransferase
VDVGGSVPPWAYRTTMRFAVAPDGRVGLRAGSSHRVVRIDDCLVAHPAINAILASLRVRGADEVTVRVSAATGECTVLPSEPGATVSGLPEGAALGTSGVVHEYVAGATLRVSAPSFFQSGPAAALLVDEVRSACGDRLDGSPWLDAYGGVGLFSATLGGPATLVESSRSACADARVNVPAATVHCTSFEDWTPTRFGLAVVDPARAGLGRDAVDALAATGAERVVLVSCDPVAMARDTALLRDHGYAHRGSRVLDLFPHTPHVEVVTVFDLASITDS